MSDTSKKEKEIPLSPLNSSRIDKKDQNNTSDNSNKNNINNKNMKAQQEMAAPKKKNRSTFYSSAAEDEIDEASTWKIAIRQNEVILNSTGLSNSISTTKYTLISWLPISILEQFRRLANIYFLAMSILMAIGWYTTLFASPIDPWSTAGTLLFVLMVTSLKEGSEDLNRFRSDLQENTRLVTVVYLDTDGIFVEKQIKNEDIKAGDIIKMTGTCSVPADMLLLLTSFHSDGNQCFIETANIDGETNLKVREAPASLKSFNLISEGHLTSKLTSGQIEFEPPNKNIHNFAGAMRLTCSDEPIPLGPDNVLLRGSKFTNTEWAYGIAIYTGMETKVQMNSKMAKSKMSRLEEKLNTAVKLIFIAQLCLVTIAVISIYALGFNTDHHLAYIYPTGFENSGILPFWLSSWLIFFILFNNFIPISLYVTVELVNMGQGTLIAGDQHIYSESLDCPTMVRASNMCQELGMVSNVFSDKTGTLTRNEMKFVKFIVDGHLFDVNDDPKNPVKQLIKSSSFKSTKTYDFLRCLTTCHTVIRESNGTYRAESPDELALVEGVGPFGCSLLERGTILMNVEFLGQKQNFEILAVNAFNADRKRMSVLLRDTALDEYYCMCKGADNIMLPLCTIAGEELRGVQKSLLDLAVMGLRTLVIAQTKLKNSDAKAWLQSYKEAAASLQNRAEKLSACAAKLESGMTLLGITAIEDRLQDEVPEVIAELAKAGIITWMLTGDKEETAVNIGRSCNLILPDTKLFFMSGIKTADVFHDRLEETYKAVSSGYVEGVGYSENGEKKQITLVMDGPSFVYFDEKDLDERMWLLFIGKCCRSVIGCRLTPTQKAQLVSLVKTDTVPPAITLAIGDGANDVSMIREGNVGIGIFGKEGRQAANNADFAIGEFKYLRRLLIVHGRWNYIRQSRVFLYSMHKNIVITLTLFWFSYYTALSGQTLYESWVYTSFNFCLGLPIIFFGIMDRDISETFALANPATYETSRENIYLTIPTISSWMLNAVLYSVVLCLTFYNVLAENFREFTVFEMGTVVFTGLVLSLQSKVIFMHHGINWIQAVVMLISVGGMLGFYALLSAPGFDPDYTGVGTFAMSQGIFWFYGVFSGPLFTVMIDVVSYYARSCFKPTRENLFRETEFYKEYVDRDQFTKVFRPPIHPLSSLESQPVNHSPLFC